MRASALPDVNEPLQTARGVLSPRSAGSHSIVAVPSNREAVAIVEGTRKKLASLPAVPKAMNAIALVCTYTMYGLESQDISIATGLSVVQINNIKMSNEYGLFQKEIVNTCLEQDSADIRTLIQQKAKKAVLTVATLAEDAESEKVRLSASQDILDRAGHRPADIVNINMQMNGGLRIEVVDRSKDADKPIIDLTAEELHGDSS